MIHVTVNCEKNLAYYDIADLHASISLSQRQAFAIGRPGHGKDAGSALRGQECSSWRDMHSLISSNCRNSQRGAGSQAKDKPANSKEQIQNTNKMNDLSTS